MGCKCEGHPTNCYGHPHNCGCRHAPFTASEIDLATAEAFAEKDARIALLESLLRDADKVVIWERTAARHGFQKEIEAALVGVTA